MRRLILLMATFLVFQNIIAQKIIPENSFTSPVDFKIYLSGSFAELRSGHFHSGIDIKTQGRTGKYIRAIADGYVSRIKVQANGYGKSVYINHPDGYTSVYGHLSQYREPVNEYVKRYQYKNQIHTLDIYPAKNELPVKKGQIIALSGNSGSSSGPHLHFEIRNAANQHPLNVQKFGFDITDNVDPRIFNFYLYSFEGEYNRRKIKSRRKLGLQLQEKTYYLKDADTLEVDSPTSFGMEVFDFLNGTNNRCGLYYIKMYVNDDLVYHYQTDEFSFAETRYIYAHTDYFLKETENERVHLLFQKPNNRLSMYARLKNHGLVELLPGETKTIKIDFADISGNSRSVIVPVKGSEAVNKMAIQKDNESNTFKWDQINSFENHLVKLEIPSGSLYEDTDFSYVRIPSDENTFHQWLHLIGDKNEVMHTYAKLMIKAEGIPNHLREKACIVSYRENDTPSYEGGEMSKDNWLVTRTRKFGKYGIAIDSVAPTIIPVNFIPNGDLTGRRNMRLIIRDDLSGIQSYKGFIDNKWVLFEYDPKNDLLYHSLDPDITEKGRRHELEIYVEDKKGNRSVLHSGFIW